MTSAGAMRNAHRRTKSLAAVVVAVTALLLTSTGRLLGEVQAADPAAQTVARTHFRKGEADYAAGKYADALAAYQAGYDATPLPGFLVNIAQCQRRLGELARARSSYAKFIMVAPDSPLVPEVQKLVAELDQLLADTESANRASSPALAPPALTATTTQPRPGKAVEERAPAPVADARDAATGPPHPLSLNAPAPSPAPFEVLRREDAVPSPSAPSTSTTRWWLWGGVAAVAVAGATTAVLLLSGEHTTTVHDGTLGTLRR